MGRTVLYDRIVHVQLLFEKNGTKTVLVEIDGTVIKNTVQPLPSLDMMLSNLRAAMAEMENA
jgi:hypothetical protein